MVDFQPGSGPSWDERAEKDKLAAVLDPAGSWRKNFYIHTVHIQALNTALRNAHRGWALDFGCGTGRICNLLVAQGWHVVGVDITHGMLIKAKEGIKSSKASFVRIDGLRLPVRHGEFDLVVTAYTFQFLMRNLDLVRLIASELFRILKPTGMLIMLEITDNQQLSVDKYEERLVSAGFALVLDEPVRLRYDRYMALAQQRFVPVRFIPMLGQLGTWECRRRYRCGKMPATWWDHLYVFEKERR